MCSPWPRITAVIEGSYNSYDMSTYFYHMLRPSRGAFCGVVVHETRGGKTLKVPLVTRTGPPSSSPVCGGLPQWVREDSSIPQSGLFSHRYCSCLPEGWGSWDLSF